MLLCRKTELHLCAYLALGAFPITASALMLILHVGRDLVWQTCDVPPTGLMRVDKRSTWVVVRRLDGSNKHAEFMD